MNAIWIILICIATWFIGGIGIVVFDFYTIRAGFNDSYLRLDWKDVVAFGSMGVILTTLAYIAILLVREKEIEHHESDNKSKPLWPINPENIGSL